MSNILLFPGKNKLKQIQAEKANKIDEEDHLEVLVDDVVGDVITLLIDEGMMTEEDDDRCIYDISLFYESLRSMIFKMNDREHALQQLAQGMYTTIQYYDPNQLEFDFR